MHFLACSSAVRVEPGGGPRGCGRLPPSRSAPLSATALKHRVRHPASLWGSARRASSAQTRTRLSRPEPIARAPERWQHQVPVPRPAPSAFAGCPIGCRWSRTMRPSPLLGWNHLAAARRRALTVAFGVTGVHRLPRLRDAARASILPSSSPRFNALVMPLATSRKSRPIAVVFCSGGSQAVDRWEVDNAFNTLHGGQPAAAASTILAILNCSLFAAPRTAAALVYCMLPRPPLCMVLFDYVSQWNLLLGLDLDLPVSYYRYSNRSSSDC